MTRVDRLLKIVESIANADRRFLVIKGPGRGNKATNKFIKTVRERSLATLGSDFAEKCICGDTGLRVDYYFPAEETIVEIALGLRNPKTEFEKDVLKAIMAKKAGNPVSRLVFISKPGARAKCAQPGRAGVINWLFANHNISVDIFELCADQGGAGWPQPL